MSRAALDRLLREAERDMAAVAGDTAVCVFTKAGRAVPGLKYHEGRRAALGDVARRSRRTEREPVDVATELLPTWESDLRRLTEKAAGPAWIAYTQGGIDALTALAGEAGPAD